MTINTAELTALANHYRATVEERTGRRCEVLRNLAGAYVAIFEPVGATIPLGATRDNAYSTLTALLSTVDVITETDTTQ